MTKLLASPADERHLFSAYTRRAGGVILHRLSDACGDRQFEPADDLVLPAGLSDVWFRGRAKLTDDPGVAALRLARFQVCTGWHRYVVQIRELDLPSPPKSLRDDPILAGLRRPMNRNEMSGAMALE